MKWILSSILMLLAVSVAGCDRSESKADPHPPAPKPKPHRIQGPPVHVDQFSQSMLEQIAKEWDAAP